MTDFHGIQTTEVTSGTRSLTIVSTAIIGLVVTGPAADAVAFPLGVPVLITDVEGAILKAGAGGTMKMALRAIANQVTPVIVLVRVDVGQDAATTSAHVVAGLQALITAEAALGVRPRILGAPGLDSQAVTAAAIVVAQKLRAMVYAAAIGADVATAIAYRANFSARELMLVFGDFTVLDDTGAVVTGYGVAHAMGLRAAIDVSTGFWKTLSNVEVQGVIGVTHPVSWDITNLDSDAGLLNAAEITAIVRTSAGGYRFWGNRTCADDPKFLFESAVRTAQVLLDTIGAGLLWAVDKPLRPSLVKDIVETINGALRELKAQGGLIGGNSWFDADKNVSATLSAGKVWIDYDYTPVPPLEALGLTQRITDSYFADFASSLAAGSAASAVTA